jgi:hypothetical protein
VSAYLKHASLFLGVSLLASTALASIPDANGVIHGCYNSLTGTARIIDGTNCGLLEKPVTWAQKGPAGDSVTGASLNVGDAHCPAGGVALTLTGTTSYICNGVPGPQGPAGDPDSFMGTGIINLEFPHAPTRSVYEVLEDKAFTAAKDGTCFLTIAGTQLEATPSLYFQPVTKRDDGVTTFLFQLGIMSVLGRPSGTDVQAFASGITMDSFEIEAGHTYRVGVSLTSSPDAIPAAEHTRSVAFRLNWLCKYGVPSY